MAWQPSGTVQIRQGFAKRCTAKSRREAYGGAESKSAMKKNIGSFDAAARFFLGWGLLFLWQHGLGWWALLGLLPLLTAACRVCLIYLPFHLNTAVWEEAYEARHHKGPSKLSS